MWCNAAFVATIHFTESANKRATVTALPHSVAARARRVRVRRGAAHRRADAALVRARSRHALEPDRGHGAGAAVEPDPDRFDAADRDAVQSSAARRAPLRDRVVHAAPRRAD